MYFPAVQGSSLSGRQFSLPADFEGDVNLVLIAFQRWQQDLIDTWLPTARRLAQANDTFRYYELPTISRLNFLMRAFIDNGMRSGIPDPTARATTITLYLDKLKFRQALELPQEETIYVMLVDRQGQILWHAEGDFTAEKGQELEQAVG
jgi:hypothetical protein